MQMCVVSITNQLSYLNKYFGTIRNANKTKFTHAFNKENTCAATISEFI